MSFIDFVKDFLKEQLSHDIDLQKHKNVNFAKEQINLINSDPYLSDIAKNSLIFGVMQQLQRAQAFQSQRELSLNISKVLDEALKYAQQMANKQEN